MYTAKSAPFRPSGTFPRFAGEGIRRGASAFPFPRSAAEGIRRGAVAFAFPRFAAQEIGRGAVAFPFPRSAREGIGRGAAAFAFPRSAAEGIRRGAAAFPFPCAQRGGRCRRRKGALSARIESPVAVTAVGEIAGSRKASRLPPQDYSGQQWAKAGIQCPSGGE